MLKKIESTGHETAASKSTIREYRNSLLKHSKFPQQQIDILLPKKAKVTVYKMRAGEDHKAEHIVVQKDQHFVFIQEHCFPILKTVHAYPDMYPRFVADEGALKFILKGANLMCPGLTNAHGKMQQVDRGAIVAVYIHNHEHAVGLGIAMMSTKQIRQINEGIAIQMVHYVGDNFWTSIYKKQ